MKVYELLAKKASYLKMVDDKRNNAEFINNIVLKMEVENEVHLRNTIRIYLPHGSGFNSDYAVKMRAKHLEICSTYTTYSEAGFEQYMDFKIKVFPDLVFGFKTEVVQVNHKRYMDIIDFSNRKALKDYIGETLEEALGQEVVLDGHGNAVYE